VPRRSRRSATTPLTARRRPSTPARPLRSGKTCAAPTPATLRSSPRAGMRRPPPDTATTDADRIAALSWERIAAAYGEPEPLTAPQPPAPSDDPPWLAIALSSPSR
jgi:hypothetical protein